MAVSQIAWSLNDKQPLTAGALKCEAELEDLIYNNIEIIEMFVDTFGFILKAGDITMVKMNADDCSLKQSFDIGKRIDLQYNPDFRSWRK